MKPSIRRVRNQQGGLSHGWVLTWSLRTTWHPSWRAARDALSTRRCLWHPKGELRCVNGRAGDKFDFCETHEGVAEILRTATIARPEDCRDDSGRGEWLFDGLVLVCRGCGLDCT